MPPLTRRALLASSVTAVGTLAGCLNGGSASTTPGATQTATERTDRPTTVGSTSTCDAVDLPAPDAAHADPQPYPDPPAELTDSAVQSYVRAFERAYQYNTQLAEYPEKLGRLNALDVYVAETSVERSGEQFTVMLSGQLNFSITGDGGDPSTPTQTPLPSGHQPFETTYFVFRGGARRGGITVDCW